MISSKINLEIALLRAISVLIVLGFHFFPSYFPFGFLGVDIFFVISGYLMVPLIQRSSSIDEFISNRIRRLYPPLLICLLIYFIIGYITLLNDEFTILLKSSIGTIAQVQNFYEMFRDGYFVNSGGFRPLLNMWSLSVEFQNYFILAALYFLVLNKRDENRTLYILFITILLSCISYFLFSLVSEPFFVTPMRLWEFLVGCFAYHLVLNRKAYTTKKNSVFSFCAIFVSLIVIIYTDNRQIETLSIVFCAFIFVCYVDVSKIPNKIYLYIGSISYSIYLLHYPALEFIKIYVGSPGVKERIVVIVGVVIFSHLVDRIIQPIIYNKRKSINSIFLSSVLLSFFIFSQMISWSFLGPRNIEKRNHEIISKSQFDMDYNERCKFLDNTYSDERCRISSNLNDYTKANIVLLGDSLSNSMTTMFDWLGKDEEFYSHYVQFGKGSCPVVLKSLDSECADFSIDVLDKINSLEKGAIIIVVAQWSLYSLESLQSLDEFLNRMKMENRKVILSLSFPLGARPRTCIDRGIPFISKGSSCNTPRHVSNNRSSEAHSVVEQLSIKYGYKIFDPSEFFCNDVECKILQDNKLLYLDDSHLTKFGGAFLGRNSKWWWDESIY
ncbi:acyltransferase [Vibrio mimicus]|uniref:acyltransferase family protein n=1 Tax=Vibrio mimicus TaxID=674 RepID=UPI0011D97DB9|nr:acyltransferase family protein [Vibrio mimicus]TXZ07003.1 acyltransferase [Vibrio mimicus]BCN22698.1 putative O-antigen polymerase [Vibrio mimicus]